MTNYNATIDVPGKRGELGMQFTASGFYALGGAITGHASTGDTITFPNILPNGGVKVLAVEVSAPELDAHATPTGTMIVGNSDDDNGYIAVTSVAVNKSNSLAEGLFRKSSNEELIGTKVTNRDIIIEFVSALESSVTTGTVRLNVLYEVVA